MKKLSTEVYLKNILAKNIKRFRENMHLSQMDLASITELSSNFINDMEHEKKCPSIKTIAKLADVFEVEPYRLLYPEEELTINNRDIFKEELASSITLAVNEMVDRHSGDDTKKSV